MLVRNEIYENGKTVHTVAATALKRSEDGGSQSVGHQEDGEHQEKFHVTNRSNNDSLTIINNANRISLDPCCVQVPP